MKKYLCLLLLLLPALATPGGPMRGDFSKILDEDSDRIFENLESRMQSAKPGEKIPVIVQLRDPLNRSYHAGFRQVVQDKDIKFAYRNFPAVAASLSLSQIHQLKNNPSVEHLELDEIVKACMGTARASFGVQKVRTQFGLSGDGDKIAGNYSKNDIVMAVADTGVSSNHPDLQGKVLYWKDFAAGQATPYDDNGHGTHIAGVAVGAGKLNPKLAGVAPQAALVVFKVLHSSGSGDVSAVLAAMDETIAKKDEFNIRILNLSFTVSGSSNGLDALSLACNRVVSNGITVVAAAGNDGPDARTIGSPAAAESVITVGAGADLGEKGFFLADFSSRGPTEDGRLKPDIWGPGVRILSTGARLHGGYSSISGTSFAAPFVAGVTALMLEANPELTPGKIKAILKNTAARWPPGAQNNEAGAGRLQAYQAVARAAAVTANLQPPSIPELRSINASIAPFEMQTFRFDVVSKQFPIAITALISKHPFANLDLELVTPSGSIIRQPDSGKRQETLALNPAETGTYTLRVKSLQGSSPYSLTLSADLVR